MYIMYTFFIISSLVFLTVQGASIAPRSVRVHPDAGLLINEIVAKYGYPFESHEVQTEDGYLLTLHRIPHGLNNGDTDELKPPVLLMHGLLSSSSDFVNMGPEKALGFLLADAGYDVWLGNQRGNTWSRKHITLDPSVDAKKFYNFSFHEIGIYDLAAKIDYILPKTAQDNLAYIAHSQGTTAMFALLSEKPEYNSKIRIFSALAPVAYMSHLVSPIVRWMVDNYDGFTDFIANYNITEVFPHSDIFTLLGNTICSEPVVQEVCADVLFIIAGFDSPQLDRNFISVITSNAPAGASIKQMIHYVQEVISGNFAQYDYGTENIKKYNRAEPPTYDISKITAPIILHYSQNDWLAAVEDVERLAAELPNVVAAKLISLPEFNHLDHLWSTDILDLLNNDVLAEIKAN